MRIWSRIGRRPILAGGNANGDIPMLRFVQGHPRSLSLLIHHDDDTGRGDTPYDKGADQALAAAAEHGFTVVSVKEHGLDPRVPGPRWLRLIRAGTFTSIPVCRPPSTRSTPGDKPP